MNDNPRSDAERLKELEEAIRDLKARLPAHSTPPFMIQELEALEEELEALKKALRDLENE